MESGGCPALHHNGRACASCRPVLIEKEIAQLKKMEDEEEVGVYPPRHTKSNLDPRYCRRVLRVISALFLSPNGAKRGYLAVKPHQTPQVQSDPVSRMWVCPAPWEMMLPSSLVCRCRARGHVWQVQDSGVKWRRERDVRKVFSLTHFKFWLLACPNWEHSINTRRFLCSGLFYEKIYICLLRIFKPTFS